MATTAIHISGDVSRNDPDLCSINSEDADNYIGAWVDGPNADLVDVRFPKGTTRELTDEQTELWFSYDLDRQ